MSELSAIEAIEKLFSDFNIRFATRERYEEIKEHILKKPNDYQNDFFRLLEGNVKRESLQELLTEGPLFDMVTYTVKDKRLANEKCAACAHFRNCQGGCPTLSMLFGGSLLSPDPYKCFFFENGYDKKYSEVLDDWTNMMEVPDEHIQGKES